MIKTDNSGQMSPSRLLLNPYLPLTLPLRAPKRMMYLFAVLAMLLLGGWNSQAWAKDYYARCEVKSQPQQGGYVFVSQDPKEDDSYSFVNLTTDITGTKKDYAVAWASSNDIDFCGYQKASIGYTFKGWSRDKNATSGQTNQEDHKYNYKAFSGYQNNCKYYKLTVTSKSTSESSPTIWTYYAIFDANEYTLTYNANGGNVTPTSKSVTYDATYETLATPTRSGYKFNGWYTSASGGSQVTSSTLVKTAGNHTIYAQWQNLNPTLTYKTDSVDVSLNSTDRITLNLSTLKTAYSGNGTISYAIKSGTGGTISGNTFYATQPGTFVITATASETYQYASKTCDFTVKVVKRTPTFEWWNENGETHIYAGDTLVSVAQAKYNGNVVNGLTYTYASDNNIVVPSGTKLLVKKNFIGDHDVKISVTTAETSYYKKGEASHTYRIEPKATPVFMLNGDTLPESPMKELVLHIGETANMSFDKIDESNGRFSYPQTAQYISYAHNSEKHTGVITAEYFGDEVISFHQTGTDKIFDQGRSIHVYVKKHEVELSSPLAGITCEVGDSVETGGVYNLSVTPAEGQPAQKDVIIRSDNEEAVKFVDGKWRAVGEGTAVLTIAQENNDFWTGDTITATITVNKKTPAFTWMLPATSNFNREYTQPVISTNTDEGCTFTYTSSNTSAIRFENGALNTYEVAANNVAVIVKQKGNYMWKDHLDTFYVNIQKLPNHLPLTINSSSIYNAVRGGTQGEVAFQDGNVIRLGGSDRDIFHAPAYNKDDKYIDIAFDGIPAQISFDLAVNQNAATGEYWYVKQKANKNDAWSGEIWHCEKEGESFEHFGPINLDKDTRYVRLCYSGNFAGLYKNVTITELKKIEAPATVGFGSSYIGNAATEKTIDVNWYNVKTCTVALSGANADCFELVDNSIASTLDHYGTADIRVNYKHDVIGSHTATLTITSADSPAKTATVTLTGETKKAIQSIIWREDITPLPLDEPYAGAALATSGLAVTLTAETPGIVNIEGDQITGVGVGTTRLFAYQAGDTKWEAVRDTVTIEVTNKHVQHIIWTDKLSNVKRENGKTVTINLTAYSDADASLPITYELDDDARAFASVNGNVLSVTAWGTGYITARQAGNDEYVGVSKTMKLVSRDPNADCKPLVLDEAGVKTLHTIDSEEFTLQGEPATIEFDAKVNQISALYGIWVGEYYGGSWHEVKQVSRYDMSQNYQHFGPYDLHINATKVKIYTESGATWQRDFKNVEVTLARYLRLKENNMDFSHVEYGQVVEQQFVIDYSNLAGTLEVSLKKASAQFEILTETVGEDCGEVNHNAVVRVRFTGHNLGTESNTIVLKNKNQTLEVPVSAKVVPASQLITWNDPSPAEILTTADVTLTATATSSLPVSFESSDNSIAEPYAKGDGTYGLTVHTSGNITITAKQTGNDRYNAAQDVVHTYSISKAEPVIKTLPTAAKMVLPDTKLSDCVLSGGVASVPGTFAWEDDSQYATQGNVGYKVVFTPENTNWYDTASCVVVVPVSQAPQTITWNFDQLEMYCNADYTFDAAASSGLKVIYQTSDASIAYVNDANHLNIIKGGVVTITAIQEGNGTYVAAEPVSKTLTIKRFAPAIVTQPNASSMKIGCVLSDASLVGGRAELNGIVVEGSFSWVDGNNTVMNVAGTFSKQIVFTPANTNYYEPVEGVLDVVVEKYAPEIVQTLHGATITYGQTLSESALSGTLTATDNVKIPSEEVEGTYAWLQPATRLPAGTHQATVRFTPTNQDWYEAVDFPVQLTVNKASAAGLTVSGTSEIFYGQILGEAVPVNTTVDPVNGGVVAGTMAWDASLDMNEYMEVGSHNLSVTFTVNDPNYISATLDGTAVLTVQAGYVFNGNDGQSKTWGEDTNWQGNEAPDGNEKVVILADVDITDSVSVDAMTIKDGVTVTVQDGAVLTIGNSDSFVRSSYGNLYVENGGQVIFGEGEMKVKDFVLEAQLGDNTNANPASSGQVSGAEQLKVTGDAYFRISFDPRGAIDYGWYDFTVPFEVDVLSGVYDANGNKLTYNLDYAVMDFSEEKRAVNGKYWNWFSGTLQPNKLYSITFDDEKHWNTFLFKRKSVTASYGGDAYNASYSENGETKDRGWNGMGNGTLHHCQLNNLPAQTKIQVYDHANDRYVERDADEYTYAVGTAFFVQVDEEKDVDLTAVNETRDFLAPARYEGRTFDEFRLALTAEDANNVADYLWVSASEEATGDYVIGRDLIKMGTPTNAKVAQMWTTNNGLTLCDIEMPLIANKANTNVSFFAPQSGLYEIAVERAPEDATLYLTKNGKVIWNLSMNPCELNLEKGTTEGYGLRIVAREQTPTDIENVDSFGGENVRKVMIDNVIYIVTPEGKMYDIIGKSVKY